MEKYQRRLNVGSLMLAFVVDSVTLVRIDFFLTQALLIFYLIVAATGIFVMNLYEAGKRKYISENTYRWVFIVVQFCFGGLFGRFLIYYSRSASFYTSWPFLLILATFLASNEFAKKYYNRLAFELSFFYIAVFSYSILVVPLLLRQISLLTFILAGVLSAGIVAFLIYILYKFLPSRIIESRGRVFMSIGGIFVVIIGLYVANIIPPIPLSLRDAGVYHGVIRSGDTYQVITEDVPFSPLNFFEHYTPIHLTSNEPVFVYSSVFAPADFGTKIVHEWQYYSTSTNAWTTENSVEFPIVGGQDEGYRGYSLKASPRPGYWRVDVKTLTGATIGRVNFKIISVAKQPLLKTENR
jgi:hypothetical protein